ADSSLRPEIGSGYFADLECPRFYKARICCRSARENAAGTVVATHPLAARPDVPATRSRSTRTRRWRRWPSQLCAQPSELHDSVRNELFLLIAPIQPMVP